MHVFRKTVFAGCDAFTRIFWAKNSRRTTLPTLRLLRLDLMSIIQVDRTNGLPGSSIRRIWCRQSTEKLDDDGESLALRISRARTFLRISTRISSSLIDSLEDEMARVRHDGARPQTGRDRAILVGVTTGDIDEELRIYGRTRRACDCRLTSSFSTRSSSGGRRSIRRPCSETESSTICLSARCGSVRT